MSGFLESLYPARPRDIVPMLVSLYGTRSYKEIVGALVLHGAAYWMDGKGLSVMYNYLGGIRLLRNSPPYQAAVVLGWDAYDLTLTDDPDSNITYFSHLAHLLAFSLGIVSAKFDVV